MTSVRKLRSATGMLGALLFLTLPFCVEVQVWAADAAPVPWRIEVQLADAGENGLAFTSDGKYIAMGAKLWDVDSGILLREFNQSNFVDAVAISPDDRCLAAGDREGKVTVWNLATGELKRTLKIPGTVEHLNFGRDCRHLAAASNLEVKFWTLDEKTDRPLEWRSESKFRAFSGNMESVAALENEGVVRIFRIKDGVLVRSFRVPGAKIPEHPHPDAATAGAINADGAMLASGHQDGKIRLWPGTGSDAVAPIKEIKTDLKGILRMRFSPDGRLLAADDFYGSASVLDIETGRAVAQFASVGPRHSAFSPVGKIFSRGEELWDLESGIKMRRFGNEYQSFDSVVVSPAGDLMVTGHDENLSLWSLSTAQLLKKIRKPLGGSGRPVAITPDGRSLIAFETKNIHIFDLPSGKYVRSISSSGPPFHAGSWKNIESIAVSPDGRFAFSGASEGPVRMFNLSTGKRVKDFPDATDVPRGALAVTRDGKFLITGRRAQSYNSLVPARVWDISTGAIVGTLNANISGSVAPTPDGRFIVLTTPEFGSGVWLVDLNSGEVAMKYRSRGNPRAAAPTSDGAGILTVDSQNGFIHLWDKFTGALLRTFRDPGVAAIAPLPDGKKFASVSTRGRARVWELATGRKITFVGSPSTDDWIIFDEDGFFDGSKNAAELVKVVSGLTPFGIDQIAPRTNRPDILIEELGAGKDEVLNHYQARHLQRLRMMNLDPDPSSEDAHQPAARILSKVREGKHLQITSALTDSRLPFLSYNIHVNDVPIFGIDGKPAFGNRFSFTDWIELLDGRNKIEVSCRNAAGVECLRGITFADYDEPDQGDLYYLGFGVSDYKDDTLDLNYAGKDALDLGDLFSPMATNGFFRRIHTKTYLDGEVTIPAIKAAKVFLEKASVDDTVVLFIAGHGVHADDAAATYYFAVHDTAIDDLAGTGAEFSLLEDLLMGIKPQKKLFLMDTCESGELDPEYERSLVSDARGRGLRARGPRRNRAGGIGPRRKPRPFVLHRNRFIYNDLLRRSGAIVLSSSRGGELSYERDDLQNGIFTEAILSAFSGVGDTDHSGSISTDELRDFVASEVSRMSGGMQNPTVDRDNLYLRIEFPAR